MNTNAWLPALAVGLVLLLAVFNMPPTQIVVSDGADNVINKVTVTGSSDMKFNPDQATVSLAVESNGKTPKEASDRNKAAMNSVQAALRAAGIHGTDMETSGYNLYEDKRWENQRHVSYGYKVTHTLTFKTNRVNDVGEFVDTAVKAGANRVNNAQFGLSEQAKKNARDTALADATKVAKSKAETLASSLNLRVGKAIVISESSPSYQPYYGRVAMAMDMAESAPTPIQPGEVGVATSVTVTFELI